MKKIESYSDFKLTADGTAEFRVKYIDGKTEHFRISQETLKNLALSMTAEASSMVKSRGEVTGFNIIRADASGRIALQVKGSNNTTTAIVFDNDTALKVAEGLLGAITMN